MRTGTSDIESSHGEVYSYSLRFRGLTRATRMNVRRYRTGSQVEPSSRDISDSFYSLGRFFTRLESRSLGDKTTRNWRKIRVENKIESFRRPRSSSFSVLSEHDHHMKQHMRRSSFSRHPHRQGFAGLPVRAWSPEYTYLPGAAVGYKRLWMQNNPWPDRSSKDVGPKREAGQEHLHRMKFREHRRQYHEQEFVPGGSCRDPLNLKAAASGEELPLFAPSPIPAPDPDRYLPVNNFIPINQQDPLGLTQDEDNQMPVALKYPLKSKRKRHRCKKKENVGGESSTSCSQSHVDCLEDVNMTSDTIDNARELGGSHNLDNNIFSEDSSMVQPTNYEESEPHSQMDCVSETENHDFTSGPKTAANETQGISKMLPESVDNNSTTCADTTANQAVDVLVDISSGVSGSDKSQSGADDVAIDNDDENAYVHRNSSDSDQHHEDKGNFRTSDVTDGEMQDIKRRGMTVHMRSRSTSQQQGKYGSESSRKLKQELDQKLKELQKKAFSLKHLYPVPQSPIDNEEKQQVARNRKSLKKALRIEPFNPEEQAKVN